MPYYDDPRARSGGRFSNSHMRFAAPGWLFMILGTILILLGFVDIGWTSTKYGNNCAVVATRFFDPCKAKHVYTYAAAPIWGGLAILVAAFVSLMMTPRRLSRMGNEWLFYLFVGLAMFIAFLICPAIIVLMALEIWLNDGTFYNSNVNGSLAAYDATKFALPIVIAVVAAITFFVAIAAAVIGCFCRPLHGSDVDVIHHVKTVPRREKNIVVVEDPIDVVIPPKPYHEEPREPVYLEKPRYEDRSSYYYVDKPSYRESRDVVVVDEPRRPISTRDSYDVVYVDEPRHTRSQILETVVERPTRYRRDYYDDDFLYGDYGSRFGSVYTDFLHRPLRAIKY